MMLRSAERRFRSSLFVREWEDLRSEFESLPEFVMLVTSVRAARCWRVQAIWHDKRRASKLIREAHETLKGEVVLAHDLYRF
jgi:hypothetical protein